MSKPQSRSLSRTSRLSSISGLSLSGSGSSARNSRKSSKKRRKSKIETNSFEDDDDYLDEYLLKVNTSPLQEYSLKNCYQDNEVSSH